MFNKILSNLPFNPSMIEEASFYTRRLKQEQSVRRLGVVMIVLSMLVQVFAAAIPPEKSLAYSDNHIINGVKNRSDILRAWDNPRSDVSDIYRKFGVTRQDIADLPYNPNAKIRSTNQNFWSIGRNSLSGYSNIKQPYKQREIALRADNGTTLYMRQLHAWDTRGSYSDYQAFRGRNSTTGQPFWIIVDCGNYTQIGRQTPNKPKLQIKKSIEGNPRTVRAGQNITFRVEYRNRSPDSMAENVVIHDNMDIKLYRPFGNLGQDSRGYFKKQVGNLRFTSNSLIFKFNAKVKANLKNGTRLCNTVKITARGIPSDNSKVCTVVKNPTKTRETTPTPPTPTQQKEIATPKEQPEEQEFEQPNPEEPAETIPPSLSKNVKNVTQNLEGQEAIDSTVKAGDLLEYKLVTTNSQKIEKTNYEISDYIGDILDYANLDKEFLAEQGGTFNQDSKKIVWANQTLPADSDTVKIFRVKMKSPLPSTNSPSNLSNDFDCKISNEYGDEISMDVQCPFVKTVEELPNTGPGEAVGAAFVVSMVSGYFFARSRLMAKELSIAKKNYAATMSGR